MIDFPIGTIVGFAGHINEDALSDAGWLLCEDNGLGLDDTDYAALRAVIETNYGSDAVNFYVPNLSGYFLRGVDPSAAVDRDAAARTGHNPAHTNAGASGTAVGSAQADAILQHTHTIADYPGTQGSMSGNGQGCIWSRPDIVNNGTSDAAGGTETRPVNLSIRFLIKYKHTDEAAIATSTVVFYAAGTAGDPTVAQGWMACDGRGLDPGKFSVLHDSIVEDYGASGETFCVPDYRGMFLRGVDHGRGKDPEAAARTCSRPDLASHGQAGNTGDNAGSMQADQIASHTHPFTWRNFNYTTSTRDGCDNYIWQTVQIYTSERDGTCGENRAKNKAVNHLICLDPGMPGFAIPIGSVVAFAGPPDRIEDPSWRLCDGSAMDQPTYPELAGLLGNFNGSLPGHFMLPDYRGFFLRGVDGGRGTDCDRLARTAPRPDLVAAGGFAGATGDSVASMQDDGFTAHTHNYACANGSTVEATTEGSVPMVYGAQGTRQTDVQTDGTSETRGKNIYVNFLIKVK